MSPPPFTSVNYLGGKRFGTAIEYREATDTFTQSKVELMNEAFSFDSTIEELNDYILKQ